MESEGCEDVVLRLGLHPDYSVECNVSNVPTKQNAIKMYTTACKNWLENEIQVQLLQEKTKRAKADKNAKFANLCQMHKSNQANMRRIALLLKLSQKLINKTNNFAKHISDNNLKQIDPKALKDLQYAVAQAQTYEQAVGEELKTTITCEKKRSQKRTQKYNQLLATDRKQRRLNCSEDVASLCREIQIVHRDLAAALGLYRHCFGQTKETVDALCAYRDRHINYKMYNHAECITVVQQRWPQLDKLLASIWTE